MNNVWQTVRAGSLPTFEVNRFFRKARLRSRPPSMQTKMSPSASISGSGVPRRPCKTPRIHLFISSGLMGQPRISGCTSVSPKVLQSIKMSTLPVWLLALTLARGTDLTRSAIPVCEAGSTTKDASRRA